MLPGLVILLIACCEFILFVAGHLHRSVFLMSKKHVHLAIKR
jgi:hypothetical protein